VCLTPIRCCWQLQAAQIIWRKNIAVGIACPSVSAPVALHQQVLLGHCTPVPGAFVNAGGAQSLDLITSSPPDEIHPGAGSAHSRITGTHCVTAMALVFAICKWDKKSTSRPILKTQSISYPSCDSSDGRGQTATGLLFFAYSGPDTELILPGARGGVVADSNSQQLAGILNRIALDAKARCLSSRHRVAGEGKTHRSYSSSEMRGNTAAFDGPDSKYHQ